MWKKFRSVSIKRQGTGGNENRTAAQSGAAVPLSKGGQKPTLPAPITHPFCPWRNSFYATHRGDRVPRDGWSISVSMAQSHWGSTCSRGRTGCIGSDRSHFRVRHVEKFPANFNEPQAFLGHEKGPAAPSKAAGPFYKNGRHSYPFRTQIAPITHPFDPMGTAFMRSVEGNRSEDEATRFCPV